MNGIEKITARIDADTQREIDTITAEARAKAEAIAAGYDEKAQAKRSSVLQKGEIAATLREERLVSVARLEAKKLLLGAKQEMVTKAFDLALSKLCNLPEEEYVALLANLAVAAARTGRETVILSQKDRTRLGKTVVTTANEMLAKNVSPKLPQELTAGKAGALLGRVVAGASALLSGTGMLTLAEEVRPMAGGLILRDDRVETNCTFETLIHLQRDNIAAQVAGTLFA